MVTSEEMGSGESLQPVPGRVTHRVVESVPGVLGEEGLWRESLKPAHECRGAAEVQEVQFIFPDQVQPSGAAKYAPANV